MMQQVVGRGVKGLSKDRACKAVFNRNKSNSDNYHITPNKHDKIDPITNVNYVDNGQTNSGMFNFPIFGNCQSTADFLQIFSFLLPKDDLSGFSSSSVGFTEISQYFLTTGNHTILSQNKLYLVHCKTTVNYAIFGKHSLKLYLKYPCLILCNSFLFVELKGFLKVP